MDEVESRVQRDADGVGSIRLVRDEQLGNGPALSFNCRPSFELDYDSIANLLADAAQKGKTVAKAIQGEGTRCIEAVARLHLHYHRAVSRKPIELAGNSYIRVKTLAIDGLVRVHEADAKKVRVRGMTPLCSVKDKVLNKEKAVQPEVPICNAFPEIGHPSTHDDFLPGTDESCALITDPF